MGCPAHVGGVCSYFSHHFRVSGSQRALRTSQPQNHCNSGQRSLALWRQHTHYYRGHPRSKKRCIFTSNERSIPATTGHIRQCVSFSCTVCGQRGSGYWGSTQAPTEDKAMPQPSTHSQKATLACHTPKEQICMILVLFPGAWDECLNGKLGDDV